MTDDTRSELAGEVNQPLKTIRARITTLHQPEHKLTDNRTFIRGWNEALGHVEKIIREELEEK